MAKAPLLDLSTLIERPTIKIDGASYELRTPHELSILDSQALTEWGRQIEGCAREGETGERLSSLIDAVVKKVVVDLPPAVFDKLPGAHRMAIVEVFTGLLTLRKTRVAGAVVKAIMQVESLLTGANTSLASSDFTAATPSAGSEKFPARS